MSEFSYSDRKNLWIAAGGNPLWADLAAAISMAENQSGDPLVISGAGDVGLWQINIPAHPQYTIEQMQNPMQNARAAVVISNNGTNWKPWVTYNNGSYRPFLQGTSPDSITLASMNCATVTIPMPSLPGMPSATLCLDGSIGLASIGMGILLITFAGILLAAFAIKHTAIGKALKTAAKAHPVGRVLT